jgi:hypothetical protein
MEIFFSKLHDFFPLLPGFSFLPVKLEYWGVKKSHGVRREYFEKMQFI